MHIVRQQQQNVWHMQNECVRFDIKMNDEKMNSLKIRVTIERQHFRIKA